MKKFIFLAILGAFVFASCQQQKEDEPDIITKQRTLVTEPDLTEMQIWIDPMQDSTQMIPAFKGQWHDDKSTMLFAVDQYSHYGINGFEFEEGYRCTLIVKECHYTNPPTDFLNTWYELLKIISKTKAE